MSVQAAGGGTFAQRLNCADCKRSFMSALCYEIITLVIAVTVLLLMWKLLGVAQLPVSSTFVTMNSVAFLPGMGQCAGGVRVDSLSCLGGAGGRRCPAFPNCECGACQCPFLINASARAKTSTSLSLLFNSSV